jgi:hypothetical protein
MNGKKLRGWTALCALVTLLACGGGGGDDAPSGVRIPQGTRSGTASANSEITAANASSFAGPLARAVMSAGDPKSVPGVSNGRDTPQARGERMALHGQRWVRLALANLSTREQPLSTTTRPLRCPFGGGLTLTLIDDDNNAKLSAGDRLSIVTVACRSEPGQPASTGSLALAINAIELDGDDPTALDVTITFSGFEEEGFGTLEGSVRLWFKDDAAGGERLRLSYSAAAVTEQGDSVRYDFDITGNSAANGGGNVNLNGVFVIRNAGYAMTTDTTFAFNAGSNRPASGSVTLTDFLGNKLTLRVRGDDRFDLIFKPLGLPEIRIPGFLWGDQLLP